MVHYSRRSLRTLLCVVLLHVGAGPAVGEEFVSATITGQVTDSRGMPVAGAEVVLNRSSGGKLDLRNWVNPVTDAQGRYELELRFAAAEMLTVHEVFFEKAGYSRAAPRADLKLTGGASAELSVEMRPGHPLRGKVAIPLSALERLSGASAEKRWHLLEVLGPEVKELPVNARVYRTEPGGAFSIPLPEGEYTLRLLNSADNFEWHNLSPNQPDIVLELEPFVWAEEEVGKWFDLMWETMDRQYSYFHLKPEVDWRKQRDSYRPRAVQATNTDELSDVLKEMLAPLKDLHVWVDTPSGRVGTYRRPYNFNGNKRVTAGQLVDKTVCGEFAIVGRTKRDGFGYFLMLRQSRATEPLVKRAMDAMKTMWDAPGFVVDLRAANGGSEPLAKVIASLFCQQQTVYAKSKYRSGPRHDDFGHVNERFLPASADPFTKPVVCILGPGTVSSGEGFAKMMVALPQVTSVGLNTRGASGNPGIFEFGRSGVLVFYSRWVDMMPDGRSLEGIGIPPDRRVDVPVTQYHEADPTLEEALEVLRERTQ